MALVTQHVNPETQSAPGCCPSFLNVCLRSACLRSSLTIKRSCRFPRMQHTAMDARSVASCICLNAWARSRLQGWKGDPSTTQTHRWLSSSTTAGLVVPSLTRQFKSSIRSSSSGSTHPHCSQPWAKWVERQQPFLGCRVSRAKTGTGWPLAPGAGGSPLRGLFLLAVRCHAKSSLLRWACGDHQQRNWSADGPSLLRSHRPKQAVAAEIRCGPPAQWINETESPELRRRQVERSRPMPPGAGRSIPSARLMPAKNNQSAPVLPTTCIPARAR